MTKSFSVCGFHHHSIQGTNFEELATTLSAQSPTKVMMPVGKQPLFYNMHLLVAGPVSVIASTYKGDLVMRHRDPTDAYVLLVPLEGRAVITKDGRDFLSEGNRTIVADGGSEETVRFIGFRKHLGLKVSHGELRRRLEQRLNVPVHGNLDLAREIDLSTGAGLALARLAAFMHLELGDGTLQQSPAALGNLSDGLIDLMLDAIPHRYSGRLRIVEPPLPWHVKRAVDYMHAHMSEPLTMNQIASVCGVSMRTLQMGFREFRMVTPMAYLQQLRLDAAHQELSKGDRSQPVKNIALKWGFAHAGRFSIAYRKRFGVSPSDATRIPAHHLID
ncbi:AraC-type DNA-binding protein [Rhizobium mongolense subsp. loessense]|uniref:AraC-type DNA-binding protein n=1 Tax=Rhizobium mongolense subsp. loessense TaxID=158890 RepID=A0A1G4U5Z8_9HYPH|nr:AraC family transcriptional regulator [Rhizobium mongolense]SCW88991.1 AraC-type DNA-binding protein [Rhizobium mongolense subsp. loessense]